VRFFQWLRGNAKLNKAEHHSWQKAASEIWARRPSLNKIAVAEAIKKHFGVARTAKHKHRALYSHAGRPREAAATQVFGRLCA
jgi:hypothetical protein